MKFSDKKAVGCLQPITLGGTHIYTSYTGGKPRPGSGVARLGSLAELL